MPLIDISGMWKEGGSFYKKPPLSLDEYQKVSRVHAHYPKDIALTYTVLGLAGEAGEVANEIKKIHRDDGSILTEERKAKIKDELGDVLWYVAATAYELGEDLSSIAEFNLEKLDRRYG